LKAEKMSGGILWLASYPKSGNTWVRVFLENLFMDGKEPVDINKMSVVQFSDANPGLYDNVLDRSLYNSNDIDIDNLREIFQKTLAQHPDTTIIKTHNLLLHNTLPRIISLNYTMGAIYIVRNVFDVVVSFADHYDMPIDKAVEGISSSTMRTPTTSVAVVQYLGSWSEHYVSWTSVPGFAPLVLRYEDLRTHPFREFSRVVKFLKLPAKPDRIKKAIRFSNFEEVSRQEKHSGFKERVRADQVFFRGGKVGGWRDHLSDRHVQTLIEHHRPVLRALRYLDKSNRPTV
jgi:hypothetical protein